MSKKQMIPSTDVAWESGELGTSKEHARKASSETSAKVDEALGLQMISIRLDKGLIESFKLLAEFHGVGYQPLMRDALKRFAEAEMKAVVSGIVASQKEAGKKTGTCSEPPPEDHKRAA